MNGGNQMANEPRKPQIVPLARIHDLPGVFIPKVQNKAYGGLMTSIQVSGVKELLSSDCARTVDTNL